ncbi:MAG: pyridoxal phosphate-dependent aminotransferase [Bacteroidetes bacterium]|nr:pyridoxal phosphate-dependent aminotransferase [Bacteroidota bacterium]
MRYKRMPIEIEAPEGFGYDKIDCNLSESSFTDQRLSDLGIDLGDQLLLYGDHKGKPALRELVAAEAGLDAEDILITSGAATALFIVATSLLEKNGQLVVARPNYATNIETPRTIGADITYLDLRFETNFGFEVGELEKLITPATKFISLTYPHNPTGVMIDEEKLMEIIALAERKNVFLLFDETYRDMCFVKRLPVAASISEKAISISSMSKSYGLPGIRIGWIQCRDKALMETFLAAKEQICITNSVLDEEVAYQYLLRKDKLFTPNTAAIRRNFHILKGFMSRQKLLEWVEPQGGCVCFPRIRKEISFDSARFHGILLNKYATYVGKGHWFEQDERYMRIGYSWDKTEKLEKGMMNVIKAIEEARL